jgi:hypothetical protein
MMETANTHRPINRTLAVIDGGSNFKAAVQAQPVISPSCWTKSGKRSGRGIAVQRPKTIMSIGSNGLFFSTIDGTRPRWAKKRLRNFSQASPANYT